MKRRFFLWAAAALMLLIFSSSVQAQMFGRNKPRYRTFDFRVVESPHFEMYHYLEDDSLVSRLLSDSERWYSMHQYILRDTIRFKNPLIFYNHHADFQQTNAISGSINPGTGGVTEGLKNRVVMPLTESYAQTNHVLGHELVHAFQYNLMRSGDSTNLSSIRNLPLWMVEGLAEYMSIGKTDAHTAMWMRDALKQDRLPTLEDLTRKQHIYFPYRYGQAFWAFVTGTWGDEVIRPLFVETAKWGYEKAIDSVLHLSADSLSTLWQQSIKDHFSSYLSKAEKPLPGKRMAGGDEAERMNVSPALSPDGRFLAYFSEKNIFGMELYLADAASGEVIRRLSSQVQQSKADHLDFMQTRGCWSPDGRRFAYVVFDKGRNELVLLDVDRPKLQEQFSIESLKAFSSPVWSPDGKTILLNGLKGGKPDLFLYHLQSRKLEQLTDDHFAELQPSWSPDGSYIVFSTDRCPAEPYTVVPQYRLALMDIASRNIETLEVFPGAENLHPQFGANGRLIYFLSNRNGFRNLYRYDLEQEEVVQLTDLYTGISGITKYSPAFSVATQGDAIVYSHYHKGAYELYYAQASDFDGVIVDALSVDMKAATLPPLQTGPKPQLVNNYLRLFYTIDETAADSIRNKPYEPKFKLDYISNSGVGVAAGRFGTGIAGGVSSIFSDILGNNQLFASLALNGEIYDFGGQFAYLNQKHRLGWGVMLSHIPYRFGWQTVSADSITYGEEQLPVTNVALTLQRTFEDQLSAFTFLPFSQTQRLEFGAASSYYSFRRDRFSNYFYNGIQLGEDRDKLAVPEGYFLHQFNAALVGDWSHFGMASPAAGGRYRLEVQGLYGALNFFNLTADYRHYQFIKPVTLAARLMHLGRYGRDAQNNLLFPYFLGNPFFIRGYDHQSVLGKLATNGRSFGGLSGTNMLLANLEVRFPLTGPARLALIGSSLFFSELNLFADAGLAYDTNFPLIMEPGEQQRVSLVHRPVVSTGISARVNLFGQLIIEPYYALPISAGGLQAANFGINFWPGW